MTFFDIGERDPYGAEFFRKLEGYLWLRYGTPSQEEFDRHTTSFMLNYRRDPVDEMFNTPAASLAPVPLGTRTPPRFTPNPTTFDERRLYERYEQVCQRVIELRVAGLRSDIATASKDHQTVTITRANRTVETRKGGSKAWRNNNPGNIKAQLGAFGSIGKNGDFLIFTNEQAGSDALITNLKTSDYQTLTVAGAIKKWAPTKDNNDPVTCANHVEKWTGVTSSTKMSALTSTQLNAVAEAIKRQEGWREGTVITKPFSANH
jgi:hypothetical protein